MSYHDESKTIYTDDGFPIPWLSKTHENYLDKTTLVYGGTGSGKTTIIEEILYLCKDFIPNYLVITPPTSAKAYIKKLPARCIKSDLTKIKLQKIWNRQVHYTELYNTANDMTTLASLFVKAPDRQSSIMVRAMAQSAKNKIDEINRNTSLNYANKKSQIVAIEEARNKKIKLLYKQTIRQYRSMLEKRTDLTNKEKVALEYLDINPRLMLIIDDCSENFKGWMKLFKKGGETNVFESIFYRGRHNFITLVFAAHDDKLVDTELRKNSRVSIYANSQALISSMNKQQSGFSSQEKKDAMKIAGKLFGSEERGIKTHQKFCYVREDPQPFKYTIADLYPDFKLGCSSLYELTEKMPKLGDNLENNPYLKDIIDNKQKRKPVITNSSTNQKRKPRLKYD